MSTETTQKALVGTWRLVSFHLRTLGGDLTYPFGRDAVGYYVFSESGYMSVAVMKANRPQFVAGDILGGSTEEKVAAAEGYISYSGKYEVQGDKVVAHPEVSFFPNWVGVDQVRLWALEGNRLTLSTPPVLVRGMQQTAHLVWERV
jgi:lipocalin-like protein